MQHNLAITDGFTVHAVTAAGCTHYLPPISAACMNLWMYTLDLEQGSGPSAVAANFHTALLFPEAHSIADLLCWGVAPRSLARKRQHRCQQVLWGFFARSKHWLEVSARQACAGCIAQDVQTQLAASCRYIQRTLCQGSVVEPWVSWRCAE